MIGVTSAASLKGRMLDVAYGRRPNRHSTHVPLVNHQGFTDALWKEFPDSNELRADSSRLAELVSLHCKLIKRDAVAVAHRACWFSKYHGIDADGKPTYWGFVSAVENRYSQIAAAMKRKVLVMQARTWKKMTREENNKILAIASGDAKRYKVHRQDAFNLLRDRLLAEAKGVSLLEYLGTRGPKVTQAKVNYDGGARTIEPPRVGGEIKTRKVPKTNKRRVLPAGNLFTYLGIEESNSQDISVLAEIFGKSSHGQERRGFWGCTSFQDPCYGKLAQKLVSAGFVREKRDAAGVRYAVATQHELDILRSYVKKRRAPKARPRQTMLEVESQPAYVIGSSGNYQKVYIGRGRAIAQQKSIWRKSGDYHASLVETQARVPGLFKPWTWIRPHVPVRVNIQAQGEITSAMRRIGESVERISQESLTLGLDQDTATLLSAATTSIDNAVNGDGRGPGMRQSVEKAADALKAVADRFGDMADSCSNSFSRLTGVIKTVGVIVAAYALLRALPRLRKHAMVILSLAGALVPGALWLRIKGYMPSATNDTDDDENEEIDDIPEVQSLQIDEGTIGNLTKICIISLCFFLPLAKGTVNGTKFMRELSMFDAASKGGVSVGKFLASLLEQFVNVVRSSVGKGPARLLSTQSKRVDDWITRVDKASSDIKFNRVKATTRSVGDLVVLARQGHHFLADSTTPPLLRSTIILHINRLNEVVDSYGPLISERPTVRVEPAVFMLSGEPRIGKTTLMNSIAMYVCKAKLSPDIVDGRKDYQKHIYSKTSDVFWEGYINQPVICIDDFGKDTVVKGSEGNSDYAQTIALVNMWSVPLRMAAVELKGKTFLAPYSIVCSTNLYAMTSVETVLESPDAFFGRLHFPYRVHLRDEWSVRDCLGRKTFDISTYNKNMVASKGACVFSPWLAEPWDYKHGKSKGDKVAFKVVADQYIAEIERRDGNFNDYILSSSIIADGPDLSTLDCSQWDVPQAHKVTPNSALVFDARALGSDVEGLPQTQSLSVEQDHGRADNLPDDWYVFDDYNDVVKPSGMSCCDWVASVHRSWCKHPVITVVAGLVAAEILTALVVPLIGGVLDNLRGLFGLRAKKDKRLEAKVANLVGKARTTADRDSLCRALDVLAAGGTIVSQSLSSNPKGGEDKINRSRGSKPPRHTVSRGLRATTVIHNQSPAVETQSQTTDDVSARCRKAMYNMSVWAGDKEFGIGTVWGLVGDVFLMPRHYVAMIDNYYDRGVFTGEMKITLSSFDNPSFRLQDYTVEAFRNTIKAFFDSEDFAAMHLPGNQAAFDLRRYLITESELSVIESGQVVFEFPRGKNGERRRERTFFTKHSRIVPYNPGSPNDAFALNRPLKVAVHTKKGDCGAMVFLDDWGALQAHRLIGFHVAGGNNHAYVCVPTRETVDALLEGLDGEITTGEEAPVGIEPPIITESHDHHLGGNTIRPMLKLNKGYQGSSKTALRRTTLYGKVWKVNKFPSLLRPKVVGDIVVNPWRKAVSKYDEKPLVYIDPDEAAVAACIAFEPFKRLTPAPSDEANRKTYSRRVLTVEESIVGTPTMPGLKSINRRTSPGFPWNIMGYTSKRDFFGKGDEYVLSGKCYDDLKAEVDRCHDMLLRGERPFFVYTDSLKDELRTLEKVTSGETRLISGAPLHLVILTRMYFGAFIDAVVSTRIDNGVAVGIDYVKEWSSLALTLESKGGRVFAGDYKAFDARCQPAIHNAILGEINAWYGDEFSRVRELLWLEITHSRHLCSEDGSPRQTIYEWNGSMPSGSALTAILNSFYSLVLFVLTYRAVKGDVYDFWDYVCPVTYGDDNVVGVDASTAEWFNQKTIGPLMEKFGAKYQMENKESDDMAPPTRCLTEVQFLKRGFVRNGFARDWLCPLEIETIRAMTSYTVARVVDDDVMRQLVDASLREFALHSSDVWREDALKLYSAASKLGVPIQMPPIQWMWKNKALRTGLNPSEEGPSA